MNILETGLEEGHEYWHVDDSLILDPVQLTWAQKLYELPSFWRNLKYLANEVSLDATHINYAPGERKY